MNDTRRPILEETLPPLEPGDRRPEGHRLRLADRTVLRGSCPQEQRARRLQPPIRVRQTGDAPPPRRTGARRLIRLPRPGSRPRHERTEPRRRANLRRHTARREGQEGRPRRRRLHVHEPRTAGGGLSDHVLPLRRSDRDAVPQRPAAAQGRGDRRWHRRLSRRSRASRDRRRSPPDRHGYFPADRLKAAGCQR